jgi:XTP/dITP diphosphohydrolase
MKLVLASHNKKKIVELQSIVEQLLPGVQVLSLTDIGLDDDIVEDGASFSENALIKARAAAAAGYIGVGDDSGLCVRALDDAPGIYSARYAGEHGNDDANTALLLKNMEGVSDRYAEFRCAIACALPDGSEPIVVLGKVAGEITHEPSGNGGFGYDPVFYYPPDGMTLAELDAQRKNEISHRGEALRLFAAALAERLK